jgi:glycosyltransferase involved in cell wall biosynthesis
MTNGIRSDEGRGLDVAPVDVTLVVPTRNEAPNVVPLLERLEAAFGDQHTWEVLFVDDSDDGTAGAVQAAAGRFPCRLHHRPSGTRAGGLGGAVQEGFAQAKGAVIAVMDADLQHPPEIIPPLVAPILAGWADLVAGTRYTDDGATTGLDGRWRRSVSSGSRRLVHALVPRSRCLSDPMSGLFALDRSVIDDVDLRTHGFKILMEVAARGRPTRVYNLPYHFAERHAGASKASVAEGVKFLTHLLRLVRARAAISSLPRPIAAVDPTTRSSPSPTRRPAA